MSTNKQLLETLQQAIAELQLDEKETLRKWFSRQGGSGSSKGWVDCNTCRKDKNGNKKCKSCGRQKGEKRSKYPSCRPTPGACSDKGKGKSWGKKSEVVDFIKEVLAEKKKADRCLKIARRKYDKSSAYRSGAIVRCRQGKIWKGLKEEEKASCPPATQDLKLNTKNRDAAIKTEHIQYGPLNVNKPGDYWNKIAKYWNTTEEAAKGTNCSNCVAFDISPRMDECMPGVTSDEDGRLGYCWMHNFKCHSARSCRTWAKGGPIKEDKVSLEWQERQEDSVEEGLWANINAKKKAGKKSSHKNSNAYKDAKKAGNALKQEDVNFDSLEKKLDDLFDQLDIDINFTTHFKERVIQRNVKEEDILDLAQKIIAKYEDELVYMDKGDNAVMTHLSKLLDVAVVSGGYGEDYLKDLIFKTAYKRNNKSEPEFRTNNTSPKLKVAEESRDNKITCDNCGWSWNKADGGDDLYICHKCNNNNAPQALENFKDGKVKGKSKPGRVKKAGASCKGSKSSLRAKAKKYGGEKGKMYHWCANMKKEDVTQAIKEVLAEKATCCGRCGRVHVKGNCKRPYLKGKKHCRNNK